MCGVRARRGALFLRVRDELRMTLDSLQVAYQSSLAYGVRHALECEQARGQMAEQIRALCAHHNTRFLLLVLLLVLVLLERFLLAFVLCYPQFMIGIIYDAFAHHARFFCIAGTRRTTISRRRWTS